MENNIDSNEVKNDNAAINTPNKVAQPKWKEHVKNAWDLIKFAAIALAIVVPIRMFIAQPFVVSGESMFPTFDNGQYLIVDEISYSLYGPHRGDVVVFHYPEDPSRFFIKRIIGLPNEKVEVKANSVTIYNNENPNGFALTENYVNEKPFTTTGTWTTGKDEYFVMGDNRNRSSDSRMWGLLPRKLMVGRVYLRLLPLKTMSLLPGAFKESK
ncbi:MAG: signal peptidase I [Patescibacteria group bacterium]|nr:signal peptidase I [Patescibacteria group bacterium]